MYKILENYTSAKDKYGKDVTDRMKMKGIPDKYLLSACRFYKEQNIKVDEICRGFKAWMAYVVTTEKNTDVNKLTYQQFTDRIKSAVSYYETPNKLYEDNEFKLGHWISFDEAKKYPHKTKWCICHNRSDWEKYTKTKGSEFYILNRVGLGKDAAVHVCIEIEKNGEIYIWNSEDESTHSDFCQEFVQMLPQGLKDIIYKRSNERGNEYYNVTSESTFSTIVKDEIEQMCTKKMLSESFIDGDYITIDEDDIMDLIQSVLKKQKAVFESKRHPGYIPVEYNKKVILDNGNKIDSLVTLSDGAGRYDIGEDDGCYVVYQDKQHEGATYIFPELHRELKKLPELPLR